MSEENQKENMNKENMSEEGKGAITLVAPHVVEAINSMRAFQELKSKLLDENDIVQIEGRQYIKRSGWRKIALAFNISTELVEASREETDGKYIMRIKARAVAPNGRVSEEIAVCDSTEFEHGRLKASIHNIETKAATRAINRAISNLVGGGEVSAEEILVDDAEPGPQQQTAQTTEIQWKQSRNPHIEYVLAASAPELVQQINAANGLLEVGGKKYRLSPDKVMIFRAESGSGSGSGAGENNK